ncbi:MAG: CPBP family intramembrane metalloprotease, partial [Lachnospiraceae bacterium]|nr:CPBP family intramembrane metalloprotease [Lachnospiraceae bacterium]
YFTAISAAITFVVMLFMYKNANVYKAEPMFEASKLPKEILFIVAIVVLGVVLNYVATHFPLIEVSESFKDANSYLSSGDMVSKILANVLITPALEELVFRGIVCGELEKKFDVAPTVVLSALIFGILHFNWVQMIYATLVGLLIGYVYEETHKLWVVYAGHALLNLVVVIVAFNMN